MHEGLVRNISFRKESELFPDINISHVAFLISAFVIVHFVPYKYFHLLFQMFCFCHQKQATHIIKEMNLASCFNSLIVVQYK